MRIRRAALGLHGEARAAVADGHVKDGVHAGIRPARRGEILHHQAGVPQPPHSIHKHIVNYKHSANVWEILMADGPVGLWFGWSVV